MIYLLTKKKKDNLKKNSNIAEQEFSVLIVRLPREFATGGVCKENLQLAETWPVMIKHDSINWLETSDCGVPAPLTLVQHNVATYFAKSWVVKYQLTDY